MHFLRTCMSNIIIIESYNNVSNIVLTISLYLVFSIKAYHKKIVKVIEDKIYSKLFEIYKGTEQVMLVKLVEAIPFSRSHFF